MFSSTFAFPNYCLWCISAACFGGSLSTSSKKLFAETIPALVAHVLFSRLICVNRWAFPISTCKCLQVLVHVYIAIAAAREVLMAGHKLHLLVKAEIDSFSHLVGKFGFIQFPAQHIAVVFASTPLSPAPE